MESITKTFGGVKALDDVNLTVADGAIHAVCGENGAGKSTLMKVLSGVHPHGSYQGRILVDGAECRFAGVRASERRGIVIIHQELALVPHLSISENLFLGHEHARRGIVDHDLTHREALKLLQRVGLDEDPRTRVLDLGVGKQQLVEIAKALAKRVRVLILDEPTAALNEDDSAKLLGLVQELRDQGITCIVISHKLDEVLAVADTVTVLRDGHTVETLQVAADRVDQDRLIRSMVGRPLVNRFPPRESRPGDVALEVRGWTVHHPLDPQRKVVDGVDLDVRHGEVVGLAGLMGAGRTEFAMSLFGRSYGTNISGTVLRDGREVRTRTVPEAVRHGIAYVTEDRKRFGLNLIDDITRNVSMASLPALSRLGVVDADRETLTAEGHLASLGIRATSVRHVTGRLSGGNQQKVVLGKWLTTGPEVLILDEPTRGIDVGAKYEIYTIVNDLAARGCAVLLISSELPELLGTCDRIYVLSQGRITGQVPRAAATQEVLMRHMTAGGAR